MGAMERFEMPKTNPESERVGRLADAAERLAPSLDLKRVPDLHVYRALDEAGIEGAGERKKLIGKIKAELHRRRAVPFSGREDLIEDARGAEARHPEESEDEA